MYSVKRKLFKKDDIQTCDPAVLIGIPRLAFVLGYTKMPELMRFTQKAPGFCWINPHLRPILPALERDLKKLRSVQRRHLEKLLVGSDDSMSLATKKGSHNFLGLFRFICLIADDLLSGKRSQEFINLFSRVMKMHEEEPVASLATSSKALKSS